MSSGMSCKLRARACSARLRVRPLAWMSVIAFIGLSPLSSLIHRLPLFVEGADAFAAVLRRHHPVIRLDLEHHATRQVHVQAHVDGLLDLPRGDRRITGD